MCSRSFKRFSNGQPRSQACRVYAFEGYLLSTLCWRLHVVVGHFSSHLLNITLAVACPSSIERSRSRSYQIHRCSSLSVIAMLIATCRCSLMLKSLFESTKRRQFSTPLCRQAPKHNLMTKVSFRVHPYSQRIFALDIVDFFGYLSVTDKESYLHRTDKGVLDISILAACEA